MSISWHNASSGVLLCGLWVIAVGLTPAFALGLTNPHNAEASAERTLAGQQEAEAPSVPGIHLSPQDPTFFLLLSPRPPPHTPLSFSASRQICSGSS